MAIDFRLLVVSDRHACAPATLPQQAAALVDAGARAFVVRERDFGAGAYAALITQIKTRTEGTGMRLIIHGHREIATTHHLALHLSESALEEIALARSERGESAVIGASVHSMSTALRAQHLGASYVMFGPVYDTASKRQYGPPQGIARLQEVCAAVDIPVISVGGVTPLNAAACIDAGAMGVACITGVLPVSETTSQLEAFRRVLGSL